MNERVRNPGNVVQSVVGSRRPDNMTDGWRVSTAVLGERYRVDTPAKVAGNGNTEPTVRSVVEEVAYSDRPWNMVDQTAIDAAVRNNRYAGVDSY